MESHWETRILQYELMTPGEQYSDPFISPMTLALFQDSGWYEVDLSMASSGPFGRLWGFRAGCTFAMSKCVSDLSGGPEVPQLGGTDLPMFCSKGFNPPKGFSGCSFDRTHKTFCNVAAVSGSSSAAVPAQYQYGSGRSRRCGHRGHRGDEFQNRLLPSVDILSRKWMRVSVPLGFFLELVKG